MVALEGVTCYGSRELDSPFNGSSTWLYWSTLDSVFYIQRETRGLPVGGRVWKFRSFWGNLALDRLVQGILQEGYKIPFTRTPPFSGIRPTPVSGKYATMLLDKVSGLLQKQALELVPENALEGYYSTYFLVPPNFG